MIDSHCHLDSPRLGDAEARVRALEAAVAVGIIAIVVPGVAPAEWDTLRSVVATGHPGLELYACYGIHPQVVPELSDQEVADGLARLEAGLAAEGVAIGECGLDGPSQQQPGGRLERQLEILEAHLELAERFSRPVVLHSLRTHDPLLRLLKRRGGVRYGALMHSYSGSAEQVREYLELNAWFSFAGPVSYANARRPLLAARAVPLERLLVETDAPDQTPEPHRGEMNTPAFLVDVVRALAAAKQLDAFELARQTAVNARRFFGLKG